MKEFLAKEYYWNTTAEWLIAFGIMVGSVMLGRTVYWLFKNVLKRITAKTETRLDDLLIDMMEEPVSFAIAILGIWHGLDMLHMPDVAHVWINRIYYLLIIFNVAWLINRILDALINEYLVPVVEATDSDLDNQLLPILKKGLHFTVWTVALIVGLNNAGYDVGALIAGLGIGGLAFALAAQDSVANLFGGLTIFVDKPFTVNDRIKVLTYDGIVEEVGVRSSRLRTLEGRLVTIPNKTFSASPIENISSEPTRRVMLHLGLTYDTPAERMERAIAILREIVADKQQQLDEKTIVTFNQFGDFNLIILFIYYIRKGEDYMAVQSDVSLEILRRFNAEGLEFAFPTRTVYNKG